MNRTLLILAFTTLFFSVIFALMPKILSAHYVFKAGTLVGDAFFSLHSNSARGTVSGIATVTPTHVSTPGSVKGIYMTSWIASAPSLRARLVHLLDTTEANTVVIDIKDYSGKIVFQVTNPKLKAYGSEEVRVKDMPEFIASLHQRGVYVIGRVAVFQDKYFVTRRPDLAVKNETGSAVWKDHKGISWIDVGAREYWDYIILLAEESHKIGFDEINFDYVRFPSDGNMKDISFPWSSTTPKATVLKNFFSYLHDHLATLTPDLKISADLFGMTTTVIDDMGIGQVLENALPYFDFIDPMVYPSHYPTTFMGYKNPEQYPYEVVKFAMQSAVERAHALASSSPDHISLNTYTTKLRPWLQDFGLKVTYGQREVRAQIKATNEVGLSSWLLWSASNNYTKGGLESK